MKLALLFFFLLLLNSNYSKAQVTIGATPYPNLRLAFAAINASIHTGNIVVNINASYVDNSAVATLTAAGSYTSILILPTTSGIVIESSQNPMFNISGATNLTIDGNFSGTKSLLFRSTGNNPVFRFINDANNSTIRNCTLESNTINNNGLVFFGNGTINGIDNIIIEGCDIRNRTDVAGFPRYALASAGISALINNDNITVRNCSFINIFSANTHEVIRLRQFNNNFRLTGNSIFQIVGFNGSASFTTYQTLVFIDSDNLGTEITNNFFGGRDVACGGAPYLLENTNLNRCRLITIRSATNSILVSGNTIANIQMNFYRTGGCPGSCEDSFRGIWITGGTAIVSGNTIGSSTLAGSLTFVQKTNNGGFDLGGNRLITGVTPIEYLGRPPGLISNNIISGIRCQYDVNSDNGFDVTGIRVGASGAGLLVSDNTIGSAALINSIEMQANTGQDFLKGIQNVSTGTNSVFFRGNTIVNLTHLSTNISSFLKGIALEGTANANASNNTIYSLSGASQVSVDAFSVNVAVAGIHVYSNATDTLQNNIIHTIKSIATTVPNGTGSTGILLHGDAAGVRGLVANNRIFDIVNTSGGISPAAVGVIVRNLGTPLSIINNMISLGLNADGTPNTDPTTFIGIWSNYNDSDFVNVYYNSVYIGGNASSGTYNTFGYLRGDNDNNLVFQVITPSQVLNNIFHNSRIGNGNHFAIGNQENATNWTTSAPCAPKVSPNHNALYSVSGNVGQWLGNPYNFADWQIASNGDANSTDIDPLLPLNFNDVKTADLHLQPTEIRINAQGLPLPNITTTDIDGLDFRRGPDIGADEVQNIITFTGVDDAWNNPANWDLNAIPACSDFVIIPAGKSVKVYKNVGNLDPNDNYQAVFYSLNVQGTLSIENGSVLESCWLYQAPTHLGEMTLNGNVIVENNGKINLAGRFTDNGTFTKGIGLTQINIDILETVEPCLRSYISTFNDDTPVSDIQGTSNTNFHSLTLLNNASTTILSAKDIFVGDAAANLGELDIQGTGFLSLNGNKLTLEGTLKENTGTITGSAASKIHIFGENDLTGTLKFTLPAGNELQEFFLNRPNSGLVTLGNSSLTLNTLLNLTAGRVQTTTFEIFVNNTLPTSVINQNTNSYIWGNLRRAINGINSYDFPVGDQNRFELLNVSVTNPLSSTGNILGFFNSSNASWNGPNPFLTENRSGINYDYNTACTGGFWTLTPDNQPVSGFFDISITPIGFVCDYQNLTSTIAKRSNGGTDWDFGGSTYINTNRRNGFSSFSDIAKITNLVLLPLDLISLKATPYSDVINVDWITSNEKNVDYFTVERSTDGRNFSSIGKIHALEEELIRNSYRFVDVSPIRSLAYYRLKMVDKNGSYRYSKTVTISLFEFDKVIIYPNPLEDKSFTITYNSNENINLKIHDLTGKMVTEQVVRTNNGIGEVTLAENLTKGIYLLIIKTSKEVFFRKLVVK